MRQTYCRQFAPGAEDATVWLEASPQYLHGGRNRASVLKKFIPDARLIFALRDPTDRLVSYYRSDAGQPDRLSFGLKFAQVVEMGLAGLSGDNLDAHVRAFAQEIRQGEYARFLRQYAEIWPRRQMRVVFFEFFSGNVREELASLCEFLGLDPSFYDHYEFEVQNRTRGHRLVFLRQFAMKLNQLLEPALLQHYAVKRRLRRIYDALNATESKVEVEEDAKCRIREYYCDSVLSLRQWMHEQYPDQQLPAWLTGQSEGQP